MAYRSFDDYYPVNIYEPRELEERENMAKFSEEIKDFYSKKKQSMGDFKRRCRVIYAFEEFLFKHRINRQLYCSKFVRVLPYGSALTDVATKSSDLDMCIVIREKEEFKHEPFADSLLQWVVELLEKENPFPQPCTFELIKAKVPIIRVVGETLDIDISAHVSFTPPRNYISGRLFNGLSQIDSRFAPLCIFAKEWFKKFRTSTPEENKDKVPLIIPNSYSVTLLVVYFLQKHLILPKLIFTHPRLFNPRKMNWEDVQRWEFEEYPLTSLDVGKLQIQRKINRDVCLGTLFVRFLDFFSFKLGKWGLSTEFVTESEKIERYGGNLDLDIADVYDNENPGRRVKDARAFGNTMHDGEDAIRNKEPCESFVEALWKVEIDFKRVYLKPKKTPEQREEDHKKWLEREARRGITYIEKPQKPQSDK